MNEKTREGLTNSNTGIICKVDMETRHLLEKRENKSLKTPIAEIWS